MLLDFVLVMMVMLLLVIMMIMCKYVGGKVVSQKRRTKQIRGVTTRGRYGTNTGIIYNLQ